MVSENDASASKLNKSIEEQDANGQQIKEGSKVAEEAKATNDFVVVKPDSNVQTDENDVPSRERSRTESMFGNELFLSKLIKMDCKDSD